jgi:hypothetical protein
VIVAGCIVPHAPLLHPSLTSPEVEEAAARIREAIGELDFVGGATTLLVSPHANDARVYSSAKGSLAGFGVPDVSVSAPVDTEVIEKLSDSWIWPPSSEEVDHGITVPVALGVTASNPVVPVGLSQMTGANPTPIEKVLEEARSLARAIRVIAENKNVVVMASANTSAGLSPRAPLTERPGAAEIEARVLNAMQDDVGKVEDLVSDLFATGGSCGAGPLLCMALLFSGRPARLLAYGSPVGVGYPVAQVDV